MTAASVSIPSRINTSADFIARMKGGVSDLIKATGAVTQTADTGQINWAATFTPATNTVGGFEIFALADSLQATYPVYLKVEYGWGGSTSNPQIWVTVGTSTNGAGTLTGITSARMALMYTPTDVWGSTTAHMCYASGQAADAALAWGGWWGSTSYANVAAISGGGMFVVERSRDFDGTPNGDGVMLLGFGWGPSTGKNYASPRFFLTGLPNTGATASGAPVVAGPGLTGTTAIVGADTYFWPVFTGMYQFSIGGPSKYLIAGMSGDVPGGTQIAVDLYGATHTFLMSATGFNGLGMRIS